VADTSFIVDGITLTFGEFWETECSRVKKSLVVMDPGNTGRVPLSDFHAAALAGEWRFSESREYLRQLGALDESSTWHGPRVIITNYMQAASNCIIESQHYHVCCRNECEDRLDDLEAKMGAPSAAPEDILTFFENTSYIYSSLSDEKMILSASMRSQLMEVARSNGGKVPLHGRLFAQWLHYLMPQECPFPHKMGDTVSLSPTKFGDQFMASEEEMKNHSEALPYDSLQEDEEATWMSQWSEEEELLAEQTHMKAPWETASGIKGIMMTVSVALVLLGVRFRTFFSPKGGEVIPMAVPLGKTHRC